MAVPKQHRSKSRQGQARMHKYLRVPQLVSCSKCGKRVPPHILCENCGAYRGKEVKDVLAKLTKKERKQKEKEMASQEAAKPQEVSPEELSKR
ncbi:50S ribosomal protein L32 [Patescibacteria group bacterium]|nr:50S ribosomal protein L32 [Patescibacteria group bacterium]